MAEGKDAATAYRFAVRCEEARNALRQHMRDRGLHAEDGWRIHESVRHIRGGTEIVMRPIHMKLPAPDDLECTCSIDEPGEDISVECNDPK